MPARFTVKVNTVCTGLTTGGLLTRGAHRQGQQWSYRRDGCPWWHYCQKCHLKEWPYDVRTRNASGRPVASQGPVAGRWTAPAGAQPPASQWPASGQPVGSQRPAGGQPATHPLPAEAKRPAGGQPAASLPATSQRAASGQPAASR